MSNNNNKSSSGEKQGSNRSWIVSAEKSVRLRLQDSLFQADGVDLPQEIQRFFGVRDGIQKGKDYSQDIDLIFDHNNYRAKRQVK